MFIKKCIYMSAFLHNRCMIPETVSNTTEWIMAPSHMVIKDDSCNVQMFNETVKCQKWSFNETYYGYTRATQVIKKN